jgi:hypothetical protein
MPSDLQATSDLQAIGGGPKLSMAKIELAFPHQGVAP